MDVSTFQMEGEWLELEVVSEKEEKSLEVKIKPLSAEDQINLAEVAEKDIKDFLSQISTVILDWDLMRGEEKLPCNDEEKARYLPYLIGMRVRRKSESDDIESSKEADKKLTFAGFEILKFAQNFSNFIKN